MGGHKELHKQDQHKMEELHANPIQKRETDFSAGMTDAPLQKSQQTSRVPLPASADEEMALLQQALQESKASYQQWLQDQKEYDAQVARAIKESLLDETEDAGYHEPTTTATTTTGMPWISDDSDDSDDEDDADMPSTTTASTTTTVGKWSSDDSDDEDDADMPSTTTASTTTTTSHTTDPSDDIYEQVRRQSELEAQQQFLSDEEYEANIAKAMELSLQETETHTTQQRQLTDAEIAMQAEEERIGQIYAQSAAMMRNAALKAKIKPYLPDFPKLYDYQLAGMGKIRRTIYRVKRHYYRKRKARAKKAIMSILQMRNEPQWRPDPTMADPISDISQRLNASVGMDENEMQNQMRYYEAWKELLIANKAEQAIGALQCFGTIMAHHVGVQGKFQYHELINAYLASDKDLNRMPPEMADKLRRESYLMKYADAIENGMRYATMPHNVVLQKVISVSNLANILGVQPNQVRNAVSDMAVSDRTFVSSGVTMASTSPIISDQPPLAQPVDEKVEMVILAHQGTNGIPFQGTELNQFGHHPYSYALAPDTVFRVISVQPGEYCPMRIYVETVPQNDHLGQ